MSADFDWLEYADIERKRDREIVKYDGFEYSGDLEWAVWRQGVFCCYCRSNDLRSEVEAIGVVVDQYGTEITVSPACASCATNQDVLLFGYRKDI